MPQRIKMSKKKGQSKKSSGQEKLLQNLLKTTQQFMSGKSYVPMSQGELREKLRIHPQHDEIFHEILKKLIESGYAELSGGRYGLIKAKAEVVAGTMRMHPRGFGFVQPDDPVLNPEDIFIPKHLTLNSVDGDKVEVLVNPDSVSEKGPEGRVTAILSRGRTHIAGIVRHVHKHGEIEAYAPMLGLTQRVLVQPSDEYQIVVGDRIAMEVIDWGSKETDTYCRISHHIGHISDPSCDIKAAIEEYELREDFSTPVLQEAQSFGIQVSKKEILLREDLRNLECFTIDPDTAKDFDDAISLTKDSKGHYHLGVHIADVSHYVQPGSALDKEAKLRANSTYFPGACLPMLPSELSNNLCSLKPNVNRLTASVFMDFDAEGNCVDYHISRTIIKSCKRFTYKEAKLVLDGEKRSSYAPTLKLMVELCHLLKHKRYERGSIEFAMPELAVIVDKEGVPQRIDYIAYDITHQLVEEFMLKANEVVALHLSKLGKNLAYRVHDEPSEDNMKDFAALSAAFGFHLSETPTPVELQKLFDEALETPYGQYLATSYIRRMRLAIYSPENIGHYGLGLTHYCHFTSPIRRYVDLVAHRILFGAVDDRESLEFIATHCSKQERISAKAENSVLLLKKLRLLASVHQKEPNQEYEAIITRVKPFGIYFEVLEFMLEGFLHISELDDEFFVFEERAVRLKGNRSGKCYSSGERIFAKLDEIDFITQETKWSIVTENARSQKPKRKKIKREEKKGARQRPVKEKLVKPKRKKSKK